MCQTLYTALKWHTAIFIDKYLTQTTSDKGPQVIDEN